MLPEILGTVGALPAETGGILLGPIGSDDVTGFYIDATAAWTAGTYPPHITVLSRKLKEE